MIKRILPCPNLQSEPLNIAKRSHARLGWFDIKSLKKLKNRKKTGFTIKSLFALISNRDEDISGLELGNTDCWYQNRYWTWRQHIIRHKYRSRTQPCISNMVHMILYIIYRFWIILYGDAGGTWQEPPGTMPSSNPSVFFTASLI